MQIARFTDGGFVLHKVYIPCSTMKFSAWYDKDGKLLDAEGFDRFNRNRSIKRDGPCWRALAEKGPYHVRESV